MENRNSIYAAAYARKILGITTEDLHALKRMKKSVTRAKTIKKRDNYEGTNVGFTAKSIKSSTKHKKQNKKKVKPIERHGNYDGTDAGFTADFIE